MAKVTLGFEFESPIHALEGEVELLQELVKQHPESAEGLREKKRELAQLIDAIYANLTAWQIVKVARHENRPQTADYIALVFDEFIELHGDRRFGDDRAMLAGFAKLGNFKVLVVGHQKGRTIKQRAECSFGCAIPKDIVRRLPK